MTCGDAMGIELAEQPGVWARLWSRRREFGRVLDALTAGRPPERVVLAGCGDCHCAAEFAEWWVELRTAVPARGFAAMEFSRQRPAWGRAGDLVVGLSVSGRTPRTVEALRVARAGGARTLALTDDPDSPLAREADAVFVLGTAPPEALARTDYRDPEAARYTGYHRAVGQTKTYGALQMALAMLGLWLEGRRPSGRGSPRSAVEAALERLPEWAEETARTARRAAERVLESTRPGARIAFCGSGPNRSTARFAAYKVMELARPAAHAEIEEFCHTVYLVTRPGDIAVFFAHDRATAERAGEIAPVVSEVVGGRVQVFATVPAEPAVTFPGAPPEVSPLLMAFAAAHWVRRLAQGWGVNTGRFRAGEDEERYVRGSQRMIRESAVRAGRDM